MHKFFSILLTGLLFAHSAQAQDIILPVQKPDAPPMATASAENETLQADGPDEFYDLLPYPIGARLSVGAVEDYIVAEEDTLLDIARAHGLGYVEIRAANPEIDPWAPVPGSRVILPKKRILPRVAQEGIIVNLGEMRLYYFPRPGAEPLTFPIGVGREGLDTPLGQTTVVRKRENPSWYPTPRMREENPNLPAVIPPGPANPLGTHALYLGWPTFLIHGTNRPWGVGRRISSGCIRMYPEQVIDFYAQVPNGTKVTVIDQSIMLAWLEDGLYLQAHPSKSQSYQIDLEGEMQEKPFTDEMKEMVIAAAGDKADALKWDTVRKAFAERSGLPVRIANTEFAAKQSPAPRTRVEIPYRRD